MTEKTDHDLLVEIHTEQRNMKKTIEKIEERQKCHTHTEQLKTHSKILWGALLAALVAMVKSFWPVGS